ncbi:MAG: hypothetical protein RSE27_03000 [Ruthenibacterium sp.]
MCRFAQTVPHRVTRRLLKQDISALRALCDVGGRDYSWTRAESLQALFADAKFWGVFYGDVLCCAGGICSISHTQVLCDALRRTALVPQNAEVILPPIFADGSVLPLADAFLTFLTAQAAPDAAFFCLVPVKSGTALLSSVFAAGFVLTALRPLYELRPHYIFVLQSVKKIEKRSIIVAQTDTWTLSFLLENGLTGIATGVQGGVSILYLE